MKMKAALIALACSVTAVACDKKEEAAPPAVAPSQPAAAPAGGTPTDAAGAPGAAGAAAAAPAAPAVPAFDTAARDKLAGDMQAKVDAADAKLADLKKKSEMPKNKKNKKMKEEVSAWTNKIEAAKASLKAVKEAANQATFDEAKAKADKDVAELDSTGGAAKVD